MAGKIIADTLQDGAGRSRDVTTLLRGVKAWARTSVGSAAAITKSFGFTSMTRAALGQYDFAFTTAMPDTDYLVLMQAWDFAGFRAVYSGSTGLRTVNGFRYYCSATNASAVTDATANDYFSGLAVIGD